MTSISIFKKVRKNSKINYPVTFISIFKNKYQVIEKKKKKILKQKIQVLAHYTRQNKTKRAKTDLYSCEKTPFHTTMHTMGIYTEYIYTVE